MKRSIYLALTFFILTSLPLLSDSGHDHTKPVHTIMHEITASLSSLKKAAKRRDFRGAKVELKKIAASFRALDSVSPHKGSKEEWDAIHGKIIRLAGEGLQACDKRDRKRLYEIIELIEIEQMVGHKKFN